MPCNRLSKKDPFNFIFSLRACIKCVIIEQLNIPLSTESVDNDEYGVTNILTT